MRANNPIGHYLGKGENSFGLLRLLAASAVVVSHAWTTVGGEAVPEPLQTTTGFTLGWHAVNLFFALSGLLIIGSLESSRSLLKFAWSRFLRIYPAMLVVITLTVVLAAVVVDTSQWQVNHMVEYLIRNFLLVGSSAVLPGVYADIPSPNIINAPLWTLKYEVLAYISAAALTALSWRYSKIFPMKYISLCMLGIFGAALLPIGAEIEYGPYEHGIRLFFAFYLGVACWYWREHVTANLALLAGLTVIASGFLWFDVYYAPVQILWTAYFALIFGTMNFGAVKRFADRQDYSYAVYIIGFPMQQAVMASTGIANPWFNFLVTLVIVLPLAALSWNLIEKPALKLKNFRNISAVNRLRTYVFENNHLFRPTPPTSISNHHTTVSDIGDT